MAAAFNRQLPAIYAAAGQVSQSTSSLGVA